jgi:DNA-binding CsgD family transcriptional regulator
MLVRAGELSPHPADRSRRLVEAAYLATITGQLDHVDRLLADAGHAQHTPTGLVFAATAHLLTNEEGDLDAACQLLARALDDVADTTQTAGWDCQAILYALLLVGLYTRRPEPWDLLSKAMARLEPETVTAFRLCHDAYVDPTRNSDEIRAGLARAFADLLPDAAPWELIPLGFAAVAMDAMSDYRCVVKQMVDRERDGGAIAMVIPGLMLLCHDSYVHGQWDEAEKLADQGLELAAAYGYQFWAAQIRALLAAGAALRGDMDLALSRSAQTTTWAAPRGVDVTRAYARSARTIAAMGQGDFAEADLQISQSDALGDPSPAIPGRWAILHQVEAAVHAGRTNEARAHVAAAQQDGIDRISPRTALIIAGAAAIAAGDGQAGPLFEAALGRPEADRWPWEHARIQFAYGQWLRHTREITHARLHIRAALETFEQMGAAAMAQQARSELRATGVATASRPETPTIPLTAHERRTAELAVAGPSSTRLPHTRSAGGADDSTAADGGASPALTNYALTILDLGNGRYSAALARALEVFDQDPPKIGTQILPDLVEAAVRSGDTDAAASALQRLSGRTRSSGTDLAFGLLARSKALLTDDAEALYREAIEHLRQPDTGIDLARTHLLYGEWLRRRRRRRDAREQLRAAQELFDSVGFAAFTHRVSVELHATSEAARKRRGDGGDGLTPQEAEIAGLVADGLSNRQVAGQMFISQNTVEYHLQKVFRKVGVRSRTQLARAMLDLSPDDQAPITGTRAVTA